MCDDGQKVDLYKLLIVVEGKGGFEAVCDGGLWDLVGEECGLGLNVGSSVKLVFSKYKSVLESRVKKVGDCKMFDESGLMGFEADVNELLPGQGGNVLAGEEVKGGVDGENVVDGVEVKGGVDGANAVAGEEVKGGVDGANVVAGEEVKGGVDGANEVKSVNFESGMTNCEIVNETDVGKLSEGNADAMKVAEEVDEGKMTVGTTVDASDLVKSGESGLLNVGENREGDIGDNIVPVLDSSGGDGSSSGLKRKREESLHDLMSWVIKTANNPCDPEILPMPEKSKWNAYSNQEPWKQVLLFREAAFHKKTSIIEQKNWQSQKMHPSMYDDPAPKNYNLRERVKRDKKLFAKQKQASRSPSNSSVLGEGDSDGTPSQLLASGRKRSRSNRWASARIRVGPTYQAQVSEWTGTTSESDPKWFGTQVWPSQTVSSRFLIERDPIGKGRPDSCGCAVPGSVECVRFHISEKKAKVKLELGGAFNHWQFDKVGEDVRNLWKNEDEKRFREVIQFNPVIEYSENHFWDHIFEAFPNKSRETLVSYYFNVYLLQRRAYHTRHSPDNIDDIRSDDGEYKSTLRGGFGRRAKKP